jgi:hypothetical protein
MADEYTIEIDETDPQHVVLVIRVLRLIVQGRTLHEAEQLARAALAWHLREGDKRRSQTEAGRSPDDATAASAEPPDAAQAA